MHAEWSEKTAIVKLVSEVTTQHTHMYTQYITGRILVAINHTCSTVCLTVLAIGQGLGIRLPPVLEQEWKLDYHQYWNKNGNEATTNTGTGLGIRLPPVLEQEWE